MIFGFQLAITSTIIMTLLIQPKYMLLLILVLGSMSFYPKPDPAELYIATYKELAVDEMYRSGIPASIKLAQALVESNSGQSVLAGRANNHFGIKCKSYWDGGRYFYADDDRDVHGRLVASCFRRYGSAEESYSDHSNFLSGSSRYAELFEYSTTDYKSWAYGLKRCGYATDPAYAHKLIEKIELYGLDRWDALVR